MSKHTPGPWVVEKYENKAHNYHGFNVDSVDGESVAQSGEYPYFCIVSEANARLIAAAPDLLEACKQLLEHGRAASELCEVWPVACKLARAAIAKAEGGVL